MSNTRCFVAIELPDEIRSRMHETCEAVISAAPQWRGEKWVAEQNLHLTLKFLGSLGDEDLVHVREALAAAVVDGPPFLMDVASLAAVPRPSRCSMVWARLSDPEGGCADVAARVEAAAVSCGLPAEQRAFSPHITLARARRPHPLLPEALTCGDAVLTCTLLSMSVPSVTLFSSTLTRTGPVYETIDSWTLSGPRPDVKK